MEGYWPTTFSLALVLLCGVVAAIKGGAKVGTWLIHGLIFVVVAAIFTPGIERYDSIIIALFAIVAFVLFFGFGLSLGGWILSARKAWRRNEAVLAEDGFHFSGEDR